MMQEWWKSLFEEMLRVSLSSLLKMEELVDKTDSIEAMRLLMEAADNYHFLQQAYHDRCGGTVHVEFIYGD
tara:strand:+ start:1041 stop:1253 length:213 start_codon:yes stop_codon:yes gene_type:complete